MIIDGEKDILNNLQSLSERQTDIIVNNITKNIKNER